jgi:hypothetical protein
MADKKKKVIARSKAIYRGFLILEVANGFVIFVGLKKHEFGTFPAATAFVDAWHMSKVLVN